MLEQTMKEKRAGEFLSLVALITILLVLFVCVGFHTFLIDSSEIICLFKSLCNR